MKTPNYIVYSINKATNAMTKVGEGTHAQMGSLMNRMRHTNSKDARYALYCGDSFRAATNN